MLFLLWSSWITSWSNILSKWLYSSLSRTSKQFSLLLPVMQTTQHSLQQHRAQPLHLQQQHSTTTTQSLQPLYHPTTDSTPIVHPLLLYHSCTMEIGPRLYMYKYIFCFWSHSPDLVKSTAKLQIMNAPELHCGNWLLHCCADNPPLSTNSLFTTTTLSSTHFNYLYWHSLPTPPPLLLLLLYQSSYTTTWMRWKRRLLPCLKQCPSWEWKISENVWAAIWRPCTNR